MRFLRSALFFLLGFALAGFSVAAFASAASWGRSTSLNYPGVSGGARAPGWYGSPIYDFPDAPGGFGHFRDINRVGVGGRIFDVDSRRVFSPGNLAKAGRAMAKVYGPVALGLTLADLVWDPALGIFQAPEESAPWPSNICWEAFGTGCVSGDQSTIEAKALSIWPDMGPITSFEYRPQDTAYGPFGRILVRFGSATMGFSATQVCAPGHTLVGSVCQVNEAAWRHATDAEIEDAIYVELVARGMGSDLARRLIEAGYRPDVSEITTTGPSSIPGSTTTSTTSGPSGTTTTTRETSYDMDYAPGSVTIKERTTETTTAPDGSTTTTTTESTPPATGGQSQPQPSDQPEPQYSLDFQDSPFPEIPDFYEQKFPDGFAGSWSSRKSELETTSLFSLVTAFASGAPSSGTCPSWSMNLNMPGVVSLGTHNLAPPCEVWPFIKAIMIITALFVARRLIFGG